MSATILICPHCGADLSWDKRRLLCSKGHSFDQARQGYVNLYIPAGRPPQIPGDSNVMLQARRRFLEAGHYKPLIAAISALLGSAPEDELVVDAGCGEGYYLRTLTDQRNSQGFGFDRTKDAVKLAAGRDNRNSYFVADSWQPLLLKDASVSLILNIFAPRNPSEFKRILREDGQLLVITPNDGHLLAMRSKFGLLGIEPEKKDRLSEQLSEYFQLIEARTIEFDLSLDTAGISDLVTMTPANHHLNEQQRLEVQSTSMLTVSTNFQLSLWQPNKQEK